MGMNIAIIVYGAATLASGFTLDATNSNPIVAILFGHCVGMQCCLAWIGK